MIRLTIIATVAIFGAWFAIALINGREESVFQRIRLPILFLFFMSVIGSLYLILPKLIALGQKLLPILTPLRGLLPF